VLEGQALEHALTLGKIEVLSARYLAPNARAWLIIGIHFVFHFVQKIFGIL
jgi:hypothetical protein